METVAAARFSNSGVPHPNNGEDKNEVSVDPAKSQNDILVCGMCVCAAAFSSQFVFKHRAASIHGVSV